MTVAVAMLGARLHYAVPRILHRAGLLARLFTDFHASGPVPRAAPAPGKWRSAPFRRALSRVAAGIPVDRVTAFNAFGLRYARAVARARTQEERLSVFLRAGGRFCERVLRRGLGEARGLFVYNSAGLELLEAARQRGIATFLEQTIAPMAYATPLLAEEHERFPNWEDAPSVGDPSVRTPIAKLPSGSWPTASCAARSSCAGHHRLRGAG